MGARCAVSERLYSHQSPVKPAARPHGPISHENSMTPFPRLTLSSPFTMLPVLLIHSSRMSATQRNLRGPLAFLATRQRCPPPATTIVPVGSALRLLLFPRPRSPGGSGQTPPPFPLQPPDHRRWSAVRQYTLRRCSRQQRLHLDRHRKRIGQV
jgi:hypothetical protein